MQEWHNVGVPEIGQKKNLASDVRKSMGLAQITLWIDLQSVVGFEPLVTHVVDFGVRSLAQSFDFFVARQTFEEIMVALQYRSVLTALVFRELGVLALEVLQV